MLELGQNYTSSMVVRKEDTAEVVGSGDMPVLATPCMTALMENAAMKAVAKELPQGCTTVGGHLDVSHVKPTPIGAKVETTAILDIIDGRKLTFKVIAMQGEEVIGEGTHLRFIVDRERFLSKVK